MAGPRFNGQQRGVKSGGWGLQQANKQASKQASKQHKDNYKHSQESSQTTTLLLTADNLDADISPKLPITGSKSKPTTLKNLKHSNLVMGTP